MAQVQPDGLLRLSHLGERLPWKLEAHRPLPRETELERVHIQTAAHPPASGPTAEAAAEPEPDGAEREARAADSDSDVVRGLSLRDSARAMGAECARQTPV